MFGMLTLPDFLLQMDWVQIHLNIFMFPPQASDGKTYDAYILYPKTLGEGSTSNSDTFVFKVLPEVLEKQCGYKLFIYGRDAYVGEGMCVKEQKMVVKIIAKARFRLSGRTVALGVHIL